MQLLVLFVILCIAPLGIDRAFAIESSKPSGLHEYLAEIGLGRYGDRLAGEGFNGIEELEAMHAEELEELCSRIEMPTWSTLRLRRRLELQPGPASPAGAAPADQPAPAPIVVEATPPAAQNELAAPAPPVAPVEAAADAAAEAAPGMEALVGAVEGEGLLASAASFFGLSGISGPEPTKLEVYSNPSCTYCNTLKERIKAMGLSYEELPLDSEEAWGAIRVISDCHFSVQLNHFMPGFLSYSVPVFLK
jgi:hypothetical protein